MYLEYFVYRQEELMLEVEDIRIDGHCIVSNFIILASSDQFHDHPLQVVNTKREVLQS